MVTVQFLNVIFHKYSYYYIWINEIIIFFFLQIKRELVYILTSPLYKERYATAILMNLPHITIPAYQNFLKIRYSG